MQGQRVSFCTTWGRSLEEGTYDLSKVRLCPLLLPQDHPESCQEDDTTVTNVTEHDREQEGEGDDSKETGVDLLVGGNTVTVHDGLEAICKLVRAVECGWLLARL